MKIVKKRAIFVLAMLLSFLGGGAEATSLVLPTVINETLYSLWITHERGDCFEVKPGASYSYGAGIFGAGRITQIAPSAAYRLWHCGKLYLGQENIEEFGSTSFNIFVNDRGYLQLKPYNTVSWKEWVTMLARKAREMVTPDGVSRVADAALAADNQELLGSNLPLSARVIAAMRTASDYKALQAQRAADERRKAVDAEEKRKQDREQALFDAAKNPWGALGYR